MKRILLGNGARLAVAAMGLAGLTGCATTTDVGGFLGDFARQLLAAWVL